MWPSRILRTGLNLTRNFYRGTPSVAAKTPAKDETDDSKKGKKRKSEDDSQDQPKPKKSNGKFQMFANVNITIMIQGHTFTKLSLVIVLSRGGEDSKNKRMEVFLQLINQLFVTFPFLFQRTAKM